MAAIRTFFPHAQCSLAIEDYQLNILASLLSVQGGPEQGHSEHLCGQGGQGPQEGTPVLVPPGRHSELLRIPLPLACTVQLYRAPPPPHHCHLLEHILFSLERPHYACRPTKPGAGIPAHIA